MALTKVTYSMIKDGLTVVSDVINITTDTTYSGEVKFIKGGYLNVTAGVNVYFLSSVDAGRFQIFSQTGNICVGGTVFPEWWGAVPKIYTAAQANINTTAFRLATKSYYPDWVLHRATSTNIFVSVEQTHYALANGFCIPVGVCVSGKSAGGSLLECLTAYINAETEVSLIRLGDCFTSATNLAYVVSNPGVDSNGPPPTLYQMFFVSQSGTRVVVECQYPGWHARDLWFTSVGTAMALNGADGVLSNITIDQCQTGLLVGGGNHVISNVNIYSPNIGVNLSTNAADIQISNLHIEYPSIAGIYTDASVTDVKNIEITNFQLIMNAQYVGFLGAVYLRSAASDINIVGFSIRNWTNYAISAVGNHSLKLSDGVFDTIKTNPGYVQSIGGTPFYLAGGGTYTISDCDFRNIVVGTSVIYAPITQPVNVVINNCTFYNLALASGAGLRIVNNVASGNGYLILKANGTDFAGRILYNSNLTADVVIKDCTNWYEYGFNGTYGYYVVPYVSESLSHKVGSLFSVKVSANTYTAGLSNYTRVQNDIVGISNYTSGTALSAISVTNIYKSPTAGATPPDIALTYGFNVAGGGLTVPLQTSGYFAIAWPIAYPYVVIEISQMN
jgi:hypothetical protein